MKSHAPVALLALTAATTVAAAPATPAISAKAVEQHHGAPSETAGQHAASSVTAHPAKGDAEPKEETELTIEWKEFHKELEAEREKQKRDAEPDSCAGSCPCYCTIL